MVQVLEEIYFESVKELYFEISPFGKYNPLLEHFAFRGESSGKYTLLPSALRPVNKERLYGLGEYKGLTDNQDEWEYFYQMAELQALRKFFTLADQRGLSIPEIIPFRDNILNPFLPISLPYKQSKVWLPDELMEIAGIAQHYGVPTRLLDWTLNFNTALYFAVSGAIRTEENSTGDSLVIWALNILDFEFAKNTTSRIPLRIVKPVNQRNPNLLAQTGLLSCWEYNNHLYSLEHQLITGKVGDAVTFELVNRTPLDKLLSDWVNINNIKLNKPLLYKFHLPIEQSHTLYKILIDSRMGADNLFPGLNGVYNRMEDDTYFDYKKVQLK